MGKGSSPRPFSVSQQKFCDNWDAIFKKDKGLNPDNFMDAFPGAQDGNQTKETQSKETQESS